MRGPEMPCDLVLSDVDGTLLRPTHALSARTVNAVRALVGAGVSFGLATGRMPSGIEKIVEQLGVPVHRVCYSGAYVTDPEGREISSVTIDAGLTRRVLALMAELWPWLAPSYFVGPHWFAENPQAPDTQAEARVVQACPEQASIDALLDRGHAPNKLFCRLSSHPGRGEEIRRTLAARFPEVGVILSTSGALLEVVPAGVTKATGARALAAELAIPMGRVVAFGDDENDIPLLEAAGRGVAMANASRRVRQYADEVAPGNADDGVATVLERMLGLQEESLGA